MSSSPQHLSHRTLLPGALLAILVVSGALFALAVVIAVGPDGAARFWLDGGGSTVDLQSQPGARPGATGGLTLDASLGGLPTAAPTAGAEGAVTPAGSPRNAARLRSVTRVQRRSVRVPSTSRPVGPAPSGPTPTSPTTRGGAPTAAAPRPVATPAPGSTGVKTHARSNAPDPKPVAVRKQRVSAPGPAAGDPAQPGPASTPAPQVDKQPVRPTAAPETGAGIADGVRTRVPTPPSTPGG